MALSTKKQHEIVVQILYSFEINFFSKEEIVPFLMGELKLTRKEILEAYTLATHIWENQAQCDEMIGTASTAYDFKRIGLVEKSILRLCIFQAIESKGDKKERLEEALRLAKKFCGDSASAFIHAIVEVLDGTPVLTH